MNGETIAMIKALQVKSIEELKTSGGISDAGKVLTVGGDGRIAPIDLPVGEGEIALDGTLTIAGAAAGAKETGDAIASLNGSLDTLINAVPTDTASGSIASFSDGANDIPVKNLIVNIESVQSGTGDPSPDNVRPISGWTGAKITRAGKNLFGGEALRQRLIEIGGYTYEDDDNAIVIGAASLGGKVLFSDFKSNTQYTLILTCKKASGNTSSNLLFKYDSGSNSVIYLTEPITDKQKIIVTSGADRTLVSINGTNASKELIVYPDECGIFEGVLTESDFVPYQGNTLGIDWTDEAGEIFGGTLNVTTGELTVKRVGAVLDELEITTRYTGNVNKTLVCYMPYRFSRFVDVSKIISEQYRVIDGISGASNLSQPDNKSVGLYPYSNPSVPTTTSMYMVIGVDDSPTGRIVYTLANSQTYQLTPQEIKTILGENNIFFFFFYV